MNKIPMQKQGQNALNQEQNKSDMGELYTENGVYMTSLQHEGQDYALGATTPRFMHELTSMPMQPSVEDFEALRQKGVWLEPKSTLGQGAKVAVTCGGVGSVWPGMGRALYDTFPAAREAMDKLAAVASWDILALMDETDMEKIQHTRWQMPYLFFVEYAQAAYLQSLGFAPCLMSGHSLGELISLCLAGTYTPEIAWQIFDRRAVYIDGLERDATDGMGMMTVYGNYEKVQKILELFPDLHICNHNTPTQFMLGGKKEMLTEARRILRKDKCPALVLPINMAFHHPHLRVLRQSAIDGLMGLPTLKPQLPVLSNVTARFYPTDKNGIVEYLADLDENTVRWVDCVRHMWDDLGIRHFVELGSADNISSLTREIEPQAVCIPVSLKNAEVQTMRAAVAHLYALGHIPTSGLHVVPKDSLTMPVAEPAGASADEQLADSASPAIAAHVQDILPIIAEAAGVDVAKLRPHMDLRHELALRSNRFPSIMLKIEQLYGIRLRVEDVLQVATIQDFADVVARLRSLDVEQGMETANAQTKEAAQDDAPEVTSDATQENMPQPLVCMSGVFSQERTAPEWHVLPWPSTLLEHENCKNNKTYMVLYAGAEKEAKAYSCTEPHLFAALDDVARSGASLLFYAPPMAPAKRPSEELLAHWQSLGARVAVHEKTDFLQSTELEGVIHLVEGDVLQELTSPMDTPLLTSLESCQFCANQVTTVVSGVHNGQGAAFNIEPALEAMHAFWQGFSAKRAQQSPKVRLLRIPPVCSELNAHGAQECITAQELSLYFIRWFYCADVMQGRWVRAKLDMLTSDLANITSLQENILSYPQLRPMHYAVQRKETGFVENVSVQQNFSAYAVPREVHSLETARAPHLTAGDFVQALYDGVQMPMPWWSVVGMDAMEFWHENISSVTEGPEGVTREGKTHLQSGAWQSQQQAALKECPVELSLRALSPNGRRLDVWHKVAAGQGLVAAKEVTLQSLWQGAEAKNTRAHKLCMQRLFAGKTFAKQGSLRYAWLSEFLMLLQGAIQDSMAQSKILQLQSIAHMRHVSHDFCVQFLKDAEQQDISLQWRVLFDDVTTYIVDGQVQNSAGETLFTVENMSFILD